MANAAEQAAAARELGAALAANDAASTHAAVDALWAAFYVVHRQFQSSQAAWNELAPAVAGED